jgi:hypothetical protein
MFLLLIKTQHGHSISVVDQATTWAHHGHFVSAADQDALSSFCSNFLGGWIWGVWVMYVFVLQWAEFFTELRFKSPTSYLQIPSEICYI